MTMMSLVCQLRGCRCNDTLETTITPTACLLFSNIIVQQQDQELSQPWLILGLWQGIYKMNLEHLQCQGERKWISLTHTHTVNSGMSNRDRRQQQRASNGQIWNNLNKNLNKVVWNCNLKHKINILEYILTLINNWINE